MWFILASAAASCTASSITLNVCTENKICSHSYDHRLLNHIYGWARPSHRPYIHLCNHPYASSHTAPEDKRVLLPQMILCCLKIKTHTVCVCVCRQYASYVRASAYVPTTVLRTPSTWLGQRRKALVSTLFTPKRMRCEGVRVYCLCLCMVRELCGGTTCSDQSNWIGRNFKGILISPKWIIWAFAYSAQCKK